MCVCTQTLRQQFYFYRCFPIFVFFSFSLFVLLFFSMLLTVCEASERKSQTQEYIDRNMYTYIYYLIAYVCRILNNNKVKRHETECFIVDHTLFLLKWNPKNTTEIDQIAAINWTVYDSRPIERKRISIRRYSSDRWCQIALRELGDCFVFRRHLFSSITIVIGIKNRVLVHISYRKKKSTFDWLIRLIALGVLSIYTMCYLGRIFPPYLMFL